MPRARRTPSDRSAQPQRVSAAVGPVELLDVGSPTSVSSTASVTKGGGAPGGLGIAAVVCAVVAVAAWIVSVGDDGDFVSNAISAAVESVGADGFGESASAAPAVTTPNDPGIDAAAIPEAGPDATGPPATDQQAPPPSPSAAGSSRFIGGVEVFEVEPTRDDEPSESTVILRADQSGAVTEVITFADAADAADALAARGVEETALDELDTAIGSQAYVRVGRFVLIAPGTAASLDLLAAQAQHMLGIDRG